MDRRLEEIDHLRADRSHLDEALHAECTLGEFSDRHQRAINRDRPDCHVDPRAIRQTSVHHWRGFIDTSTDTGDDLANDAQQVSLVLEMDLGLMKPAEALDEAELV